MGLIVHHLDAEGQRKNVVYWNTACGEVRGAVSCLDSKLGDYMPKTNPTTVRLKEPIKTALRAYAQSKQITVSEAMKEFIVEGLKRERYLTPSGRLGKAALISDQEDE
jgi:hypothetical protein